jgi:hypothetical protein
MGRDRDRLYFERVRGCAIYACEGSALNEKKTPPFQSGGIDFLTGTINDTAGFVGIFQNEYSTGRRF